MGAPEMNMYPRDAAFIWNGRNNKHCSNTCRCLFCTALRWVILPHCNCRLLKMTLGLPLDARIQRKRIICRHFPRHNTTPMGSCSCVLSGETIRNYILDEKNVTFDREIQQGKISS
ncbi:hypothetical protein M758_UG067500 [Ceratodon purpureus]|nr:hypothetical protein M758_UG067500 [Ceratodon purpureus]